MTAYHYTECGLDNVFIEGISPVADDHGEAVFTIPKIGRLHNAIATMVVNKPNALTGKEIRFLRTEMGLTQAELALVLRCQSLTISRWERSETTFDETADALLRLLAQEKLNLETRAGVEEVSAWTTATAVSSPFRIDGRDPSHYRPIMEAA
jgi:putative zinc finger/helix-turn-helix YgiT family protein